ncbi:MAG: hypothetical protein J6R36_07270 [Bacteroidaceae bacterium]|jgi:hypothetical protein|nr:hypothetical protein [Bacteroidaceae bacterium]
MKTDDIDKIIAEALEEERKKSGGGIRRGKGNSANILKIRRVLNVVFMLGALAAFALYFLLPEQRMLFMGVGFGAMILKIVEFGLRFLF